MADQTNTILTTDDITQQSPEGRPVRAERSARTVGLIYASAIVLVLLAAIAVAAFVSSAIGILLGALGLIGFVVNPQIWAAPGRIKDRQ